MLTSAPTLDSNSNLDENSARTDDGPVHERIWHDCLRLIKERVNNHNFLSWFEPITPLGMMDGNFVLQVPSHFFSDWLEEHHSSLLGEVMKQVTGREVALAFKVVPEERDTRPPVPFAGGSPESPAPVSSEQTRSPADLARGAPGNQAIRPLVVP